MTVQFAFRLTLLVLPFHTDHCMIILVYLNTNVTSWLYHTTLLIYVIYKKIFLFFYNYLIAPREVRTLGLHLTRVSLYH